MHDFVTILSLICSALSVCFVAAQVKKIKQQTVFGVQIETLSGIYACIDTFSSVPHWPTCMSDMSIDNIDNFKSVPREIELLNAWLSHMWTKNVQYQDSINISSMQLTDAVTRRLWFQAKCLWPTDCTKEVLDFLLCYHSVQTHIKRIINGYYIAHPSPEIDSVFDEINNELYPLFEKLVNSNCLKLMENEMKKSSPSERIGQWLGATRRKILTRTRKKAMSHENHPH